MMQHTNSWLQTVTEPLSPNHPIFHNPPSNMSVTSSRPTSSVAPWHHNGLVRSVLLNDDFVISGSYDLSVKVWDRMSGMLIADLTGPHTGRVFCVAADYTKIVSCGEDQVCFMSFLFFLLGMDPDELICVTDDMHLGL
jgi:WD40 repeat protein